MPIPQIKKSYNAQKSWKTLDKKSKHKKTKNKKNNYYNFKKSKNKSFFSKIKKRLVFTFITLFILGTISVLILVAYLSKGLPDPNKLINREVAQTTKIYDRTGEVVLYEIHGDIQRTIINLEDLPEYTKWATIAIEDKNFYKHNGVSVWGILRGVVWQSLRGKRVQGGSTLTQQFIKNAVLTNERTVTRKIKEWLLSYKLEQKFSKDEIIQMYFNEIPYGSTAYGIEAASQKYFAKKAQDLSLGEAAILAALPQAPSKYSPYGSNKDLLIGRQHRVLDLMVEQNYISQDEANSAKEQELAFNKQTNNIKAPHFVMYVKERLSEKYGEKMIEQGGLKITTSIDLYKQEIAEDVIKEASSSLERWEASNAALVSIDPKTGQILAMVGSRDYFSDDIDGQVNVTTSLRQPGSSLKPLVYASLFLKGYTPETILYDVVTNFSNDKNKPYEPRNYNEDELGPVTIRKALAGSLNIPAVKAIYLTGVDSVLNLARDLGYTSLSDKDRFGLSLVLGGAEVQLLEHVNAYSAFAREGVVNDIVSILKVEDKEGNILEEYKENSKKVLDPKVARAINSILSDNNARAYAFGENNWLHLRSRPIAAKTGTTNDYRDAWTIGYTPSIITGVWVGNNNNSEMKRGAAGGAVAAPIWNAFMKKVLGDSPVEQFKTYEKEDTGKAILDGVVVGTKIVKIDKASGLLATEETPSEMIEELEFTEHHSILYYVKKNDPRGDAPQNPQDDPQFELWEERVLNWAKEEGLNSSSTPPIEFDNLHKKENQPSLTIKSPKNKDYIMTNNLSVVLKMGAPRGINLVEYYINNNLLSIKSTFPFNLNKDISFLDNGFHSLKVRACDDVYNCSEQEIEFNLILTSNNNKPKTTINWLEPGNGLAVNDFDFPVKLITETNNHKYVARLNYYLINSDNIKTLIKTLAPVNSLININYWEEAPSSGTYRLFTEALNWDGSIKKTDEIYISINNTQDIKKEFSIEE